MSLTPGHRLGPYEIVGLLGAGGMGEVYRARDTRLDRTVAIKVLPALLAADPQFRERFTREAKVLSQLDHPHICGVHDVGNESGTAFLVMPFLDGETLASRLSRHPSGLALDEALTIGIEIAGALDAAHRAGIVHRDLKPGNVMLTKAGTKLLDFGLARSQSAPAAAGQSRLPTTPPELTAQGTILGTLQYMAPEQLEGGDVDSRTDIFAFGGLLFELCTGKRAFEGKSHAGMIAAILEHDPVSISSVQPLAPPALDRLVRTCLAKNPNDRWQSARDLLRELKWIAEGRESNDARSGAVTASNGSRWFSRTRFAWAVAFASVGGAAAAIAIVWSNAGRSDARIPVMKLSVVLPNDARLANETFAALALSPQGTHLAYIATSEGIQRLYLRRLDTFETRVVPGTEGAMSPFFSPDGQWVAFASQGRLRKVSITGGQPIALGDSPALFGGTWGPDDTIVFAGTDVGMSRVSAGGGNVSTATTLNARDAEGGHLWPEFLPDGKSFLLTVATTGTNMERARIVLHSIADGTRRTLIEGGTSPHYVASGHIVYSANATLMAAPFDLASRAVTGPSVPVLDGVAQSSLGAAYFSVSRSGVLAFVAGEVTTPRRTLVWMDRRGTKTSLPLPTRPYWTPSLSPDGRRIAVGIEGPTHDIWVSDVERDTLTRLTFGSDNYLPVWTPDGTRIAFQSNRDGPWHIFWMPVDRSAREELLVASDLTPVPSSWSQDGQTLAYFEMNPTTAADIWMATAGRQGPPKPFLQAAAFQSNPTISPNGRWVAYESNETGREEVYVQRFPEGGAAQADHE